MNINQVLRWPRPSSSEFLLKSKWKSFRFCRYVCPCLVWLFGLRPCLFGKYGPIRLSRFGLIDWLASLFPKESKLNNSTALPVPMPDQVAPKSYMYIYIYIYIYMQQIQILRSLIWRGFGEVLVRTLERFRRRQSFNIIMFEQVCWC